MNDTVKQALGSLETRAKSEFGTTDRISLRDYIVSVEIGAFQVERDVVQRLKFNIVVDVPPSDLNLNDDVDKILSYDHLTDAIEVELAYERLNLLETLAERISARILQHDHARRVFLRVEKLDRGAGDLGVEIVRERDETIKVSEVKLRPEIVFLAKDTINSDFLKEWISTFSKREAPVVICVDAQGAAGPADNADKAQSHIDVLALDQMAWRVGAVDEQCLVVGSRTELNWAISQGKISIWAPYKMVFDAVVSPNSLQPIDLAIWLSSELDAPRFSTVGHTASSVKGQVNYLLQNPQEYS